MNARTIYIVSFVCSVAMMAGMIAPVVQATTSPAKQTTRCNMKKPWSSTISSTYSNGVKLRYWYADNSDGSRSYCFLAERKSAPKNTYVSIRVDNGAGNYGRYSASKGFTLKNGQRATVKISLFKKSGDKATTYWQAPDISVGG